MFLEQTPVLRQTGNIFNNVRILKTARVHPNLNDRKPLFRRNRDSIDVRLVLGPSGQTVGAHRRQQFSPGRGNIGVCNTIRETPTITILGVLPHGGDAALHTKEHTVIQQVLGDRLVQRIDTFNRIDFFHNDFIAVVCPAIIGL